MRWIKAGGKAPADLDAAADSSVEYSAEVRCGSGKGQSGQRGTELVQAWTLPTFLTLTSVVKPSSRGVFSTNKKGVHRGEGSGGCRSAISAGRRAGGRDRRSCAAQAAAGPVPSRARGIHSRLPHHRRVARRTRRRRLPHLRARSRSIEFSRRKVGRRRLGRLRRESSTTCRWRPVPPRWREAVAARRAVRSAPKAAACTT